MEIITVSQFKSVKIFCIGVFRQLQVVQHILESCFFVYKLREIDRLYPAAFGQVGKGYVCAAFVIGGIKIEVHIVGTVKE